MYEQIVLQFVHSPAFAANVRLKELFIRTLDASIVKSKVCQGDTYKPLVFRSLAFNDKMKGH